MMNRTVKVREHSDESLKSRLHGLFFHLSILYKPPAFYLGALWILEKSMMAMPLLVMIFADTPWESANSVLECLNVLHYFSAKNEAFTIFLFIYLGIFNAFFGALVFRVIKNKRNNVSFEWLLSLTLPLVSHVFMHITALAGLYLLAIFRDDVTFSSYKGISESSLVDTYGATHIILLTLACLTFCECLLLTMLYLLLSQDCRLSVWCSYAWKYKFLGLAAKFLIIGSFVLDGPDDYVQYTGSVLALVLVVKLVHRFCSPMSHTPVRELAELFSDVCLLLLDCLILLCKGFAVAGMKEYYQFALAVPIHALVICIIRMGMRHKVQGVPVRTEDEALEYLRTLLSLCHDKSYSSLVGLCGIISAHKAGCMKPGCECENILDMHAMNLARHSPIAVNYRAFETTASIPSARASEWKARVFRLLISDIVFLAEKSYKLQLALGEVSFYYFCNLYQALEFAEAVSLRLHSFVSSQHVYNLRSVIERGMWTGSGSAKTIMAMIEYQLRYNQFLRDMEDSCECTAKFWTTLLEPMPDVDLLIKYGKKVYKRRYRLLSSAKEIIAICSDHTEFLVKYGLYMKYVMHDNASASAIFKKIQWAADNVNGKFLGEAATMLNGDQKAMIVVVVLEKENFFTISEINHEVEYQLGYKREELVSYSANKLMPKPISLQHRGFVQKFFQTMSPGCIGVEKTRFIITQAGYVLPCRTTKRIVPTLTNGLQGIMIFVEDSGMSDYAGNRTDRVRAGKIGALIYDSREKILEMTKEVPTMLFPRSESTEQVKSCVKVSTLFQELIHEDVVRFLSRSAGGVIMFNTECGGEIEEAKSEAEEAAKRILLWIRVVKEKFGDEDVTVLLCGQISRKTACEYFPMEKFNNAVYSKIGNDDTMAASPANFMLARRTGGFYQSSKKKLPRVEVQSDSASVSSLESLDRDEGVSISQLDMFTHELQATVASKATPVLIKRLGLFLICFLAVVTALICVESTMFISESKDLKSRFQMIEYYQIRYELLIYMAMSPNSYHLYRLSSAASTFTSYCARTRARVSLAIHYNVLTRLSFSKFNLDYDYENVEITSKVKTYLASFYYAFITYVNSVMVYVKLDNYLASRACIDNYATTTCSENNEALTYCNDNGFYSLRIQQDRVAKRIMNDFLDSASSGANALYAIISICMGIVALSSILLSVILVFVIKEKSYVMAIFAEVAEDEIRRIIKHIKTLGITNVKFQSKLLESCKENEDVYWKSVVKEHKRGLRYELANNKSAAAGGVIALAAGTPEKERSAKPRSTFTSTKRLLGTEDRTKICNNTTHKDVPVVTGGHPSATTVVCEDLEAKQDELKIARIRLLSQIDSKLRNNSMCRLSVVLLAFLAYGAGSLYFNYYLHDFNSTTSKFFYDLTKRNGYGIAVTALMRESVRARNKALLGNSPDPPNKGLYIQDYMDEIERVNERIKEYRHSGSKWIFSGYFDLTERLDGAELCDLVDSYQIGQTGTCRGYYKGPQEEGLTVGIAYYLSYHYAYIAKLQATNYSDERSMDAIVSDTALTMPGSGLITYLQAALELQLVTYRRDAVKFYEQVQVIVIVKAVCFFVVFLGLYLIILLKLLMILKSEVLLTRGMLNMIPRFVIEGNMQVQNKIWQRRYVA